MSSELDEDGRLFVTPKIEILGIAGCFLLPIKSELYQYARRDLVAAEHVHQSWNIGNTYSFIQ